jgi:hypothetical protein
MRPTPTSRSTPPCCTADNRSAFDGRKFSINVGIPSAVDIKLDGVNYGPHSDQAAPETFTVESHLP